MTPRESPDSIGAEHALALLVAGYTATASAALPPTIVKSLSPSTVQVNQTSVLFFTITNPNTTGSLTGVGFTDTLPAGVTVPRTTATICGGTFTTTAPNSIALSGATIPANGSCTFTATVTATGTKAKVKLHEPCRVIWHFTKRARPRSESAGRWTRQDYEVGTPNELVEAAEACADRAPLKLEIDELSALTSRQQGYAEVAADGNRGPDIGIDGFEEINKLAVAAITEVVGG